MGKRGAGLAAFSGFEGAIEMEAGVAGLSAFDLRVPLGVEVPFVIVAVAEADWFTMLYRGPRALAPTHRNDVEVFRDAMCRRSDERGSVGTATVPFAGTG